MVDVKTNGHHQTGGRKAPALPEITMPDSGATMRIVGSVGPFIMQALGRQLRKERTEPTPPVNEVVYGDGRKVKEPNRADPDYLQAKQEYQDWQNNESIERMLNYILDSCVEPVEIDEAAVARTRKAMMGIGIDLADVDDRDVYVRYVAIASATDLNELRQIVERHSHPVEEAIQEEVASFPGNVQGT